MTKYKIDRLRTTVRPIASGGAYITVPSAWVGQEVDVVLVVSESKTKRTVAKKKQEGGGEIGGGGTA